MQQFGHAIILFCLLGDEAIKADHIKLEWVAAQNCTDEFEKKKKKAPVYIVGVWCQSNVRCK